ncbi:MAG: hypothetical protein ACTSQY_04715 [Candidatus Odinarchaeia archaeon]
MSIIFLIYSGKSKTDGDYSIKDIPGTSRRLDVVLRSFLSVVNSSYLLQFKPRFIAVLGEEVGEPKTVAVDFLFSPPYLINEFSAAKFFSTILSKELPFTLRDEYVNITVSENSFQDIVNNFSKNNSLFYLNLLGKKVASASFNISNNLVFILGDHVGLPDFYEQLLLTKGAMKISLGPIEYLTSHCIKLIQYWLVVKNQGYIKGNIF